MQCNPLLCWWRASHPSMHALLYLFCAAGGTFALYSLLRRAITEHQAGVTGREAATAKGAAGKGWGAKTGSKLRGREMVARVGPRGFQGHLSAGMLGPRLPQQLAWLGGAAARRTHSAVLPTPKCSSQESPAAKVQLNSIARRTRRRLAGLQPAPAACTAGFCPARGLHGAE